MRNINAPVDVQPHRVSSVPDRIFCEQASPFVGNRSRSIWLPVNINQVVRGEREKEQQQKNLVLGQRMQTRDSTCQSLSGLFLLFELCVTKGLDIPDTVRK